jgi:tripartite-type tricarboxylate transporter receptor subunit TctC
MAAGGKVRLKEASMYLIARRTLAVGIWAPPKVRPEEFAAFVRKDYASYEPVVRASGAKAD